jgi:hypothetical protein
MSCWFPQSPVPATSKTVYTPFYISSTPPLQVSRTPERYRVQTLDIRHFGAICPRAAGSLNPRFPPPRKPCTPHSIYSLHLHRQFHACRSDIKCRRSISAILGQYVHKLLDPSIPGSHNFISHIYLILHVACTPTASFMHAGAISSAYAQYLHFVVQHTHLPLILSFPGSHHLGDHVHLILHISYTPPQVLHMPE